MNISAIQIFHKKSGITVGITMASYTPVEGFTFITFGESSRARAGNESWLAWPAGCAGHRNRSSALVW